MGKTDMDIIREMETILQVPLIQMDLREIDKTTDLYADIKRGYAIDEGGGVTGLRLENLAVKPVLHLCAGLRDLVNLNLRFCHLEEMDIAFLKDYRRLVSLNLRGNRAIGDFSFLRDLKGLTSLDLGYNELKDVSFLRDLKGLTSLYLSYNELNDVSFLRDLKGLTSLYLGGNNLTDVSFLRDLKGLTSLDLSYNKLKDVSFLRDLKGLTSLYLGGNNLTDVSFLRDLKGLTSLDLSYNKLKDVSFLRDLKGLTSLYLSYNELNDVSFLRDLKGLTALYLNENKLTDVSFIENLPHLTRINLDGNPIKTPPPEIVKQGLSAMRDYFRSLREDAQKEVKLNEVKVLLVGDGGAGKTSLLKKLRNLPFDPNQNKTHGIDIHTLHVDTDAPGEKDPFTIRAHFWDFGGQEIMHASHQFFLSKRALYILVVDGREEQNPHYWLKHIEAFGGQSPLLVVINKIDQNPSFDLDRQSLVRKYPNIKGFLRTSCQTGDGIPPVREALRLWLPQTELIRSPVASSWMTVKDKLREETRKNCYISHTRFQQICDDEKIPDGSSRDTLIRFLNQLGIVLHFKQIDLNAFHVLNPRWVTEGVYRIINSPLLTQREGVLETALLDTIINREKIPTGDFHPDLAQRTYNPDEQRYILKLMEKFQLCYSIDPDTHLVPGLLSQKEPTLQREPGEAIHFLVQYEFLPKSVMPRLLVKCHVDNRGLPRWRKGMALQNNRFGANALVRADETENTIFIAVTGSQRREYLAIIRHALGEINDSFPNLQFTEKIPLPSPDDAPENGDGTMEKARTVSYKFLLGYEQSGKRYYYDGETGIEYDVKELLDTVTLEENRRKEAPGPRHTPAREAERKRDPQVEQLQKEKRLLQEQLIRITDLENQITPMTAKKTVLDAKVKACVRRFYITIAFINILLLVGLGLGFRYGIIDWNEVERWIWVVGGVGLVALNALMMAFTGHTLNWKDHKKALLEKAQEKIYDESLFEIHTYNRLQKELAEAKKQQ